MAGAYSYSEITDVHLTYGETRATIKISIYTGSGLSVSNSNTANC